MQPSFTTQPMRHLKYVMRKYPFETEWRTKDQVYAAEIDNQKFNEHERERHCTREVYNDLVVTPKRLSSPVSLNLD